MSRTGKPLQAAAWMTLCLGALQGCSGDAASPPAAAQASASANQSVDLSAGQLRFVRLAQARERTFTIDRDAVGIVDYDEDRTVQVSAPYPGRILQLSAAAGDHVRRGQVLFTIESPDLVLAESTLIGAAAARQLADQAAARAQQLRAVRGIAEKDYEEALSTQQSAQGAYQAARDALRIFGKSEAQIDALARERRVDASMAVASPIDGVVTARSAGPGTLVQPGGSPAPYAVADVRTKWLLAQVPEDELPRLRLGQSVEVRLSALPGRVFHGHVDNIAEALDPATRRVAVRSVVQDPDNELHPQMFATFTLHLGEPVQSVAVPEDAVVREGDGTMSVWVTSDQHHFVRRTVQLGEQQGGFDQILGGLRAGEQVASSGALFISNASVIGAAD